MRMLEPDVPECTTKRTIMPSKCSLQCDTANDKAKRKVIGNLVLFISFGISVCYMGIVITYVTTSPSVCCLYEQNTSSLD